jgi:hypothetical protein
VPVTVNGIPTQYDPSEKIPKIASRAFVGFEGIHPRRILKKNAMAQLS